MLRVGLRGRRRRPARTSVRIGVFGVVALAFGIPVASATVSMIVIHCPTNGCRLRSGSSVAGVDLTSLVEGKLMVPSADLGVERQPSAYLSDEFLSDAVLEVLQEARAARSVGCAPPRRSAMLDALASERAATIRGSQLEDLTTRAARSGYQGQVLELVARGAADTSVLATALSRSRFAESLTDCARTDAGAAVTAGIVVLVVGTPTGGR